MEASVITTIYNIDNTFVQNIANNGYECFIVGDKKTNSKSFKNKKSINYIPVKCSIFPELSKLLPHNHYCRKNLGYLHAIKHQAACILDADDDNLPTGNISEWRELKHSYVTSPGIPNILKYFSDSHIWARGYPLELVNKPTELSTRPVNNSDLDSVGIVQSLVNGDPDVDAIFRLTSDKYTSGFQFDSGKSYIMDAGVYSQGNTQATLWVNPELFHLLYIPATVSFRFCDILKMYVAQYCMWKRDYRFAITSPFFYQTRNAHDYMKDFESEVSMYTCLHELLTNILPSIKLTGDKHDIIRVYETLAKKNIVKKDELIILKQFLQNIQ